MKPEITAVILTLNEDDHIASCLESLAWADRRVVFDSFSQDNTVKIAQESGADVIQHQFQDYARQRNAALEDIKTGWILFVDADERSTAHSAEEIRAVVAEQRAESGWYIPRENYIFGKVTKGAGWYPDFQLRFFKRGHVHYENPVHEVAAVDGQIGYLQQPLIHYNYRDPDQFHQKQKAYVAYDVEELKRQNIHPKVYTPYTQAVRHFWWRLVTLNGYVDGFHGLRLSSYLAYYEFLKYRRLRQLQDQGN